MGGEEGGMDWSSRTVDGGSAITAAAAILRQLEHLTSAADQQREAQEAAAQRKKREQQQQQQQQQGRRSSGRRVFASSSAGLVAAAEEKEAAGAVELQAVAQLATIVRMRILAALSSSSDARGDRGGGTGGAAEPGSRGSVEALSVEARCGAWVRSLPPSAIVALSELASPVPPLRAKGLSELRSLLLAREPTVMSALKELVPLIEEAMADQVSTNIFVIVVESITCRQQREKYRCFIRRDDVY
jgi:hypothetical protein